MFSLIRQMIRYALLSVLGMACLGTVLAFGGELGGWLDLCSHFRVVYLCIEAFGLLGCLVVRRFTWAVAVFAFLLINISQFIPFYAASAHQAGALNQTLRVLQLNTWASNRHPQRIANLLTDTGPDIAALEEITAENYDFLRKQPVMRNYPSVVRLEKDRLVLLSRYPLVGKTQFGIYPALIKAKILWQGQPITVMVVHTWRPIGDYRQYQHQLQRLGALVQATNRPIIVLGDLNTGPWSAPFQRLIRETGLRNTQVGQGIQPTYPYIFPKTQIPTWMPLLPIDHVLASPDFSTFKRWNGPFVGSDHLPVFVELVLSR